MPNRILKESICFSEDIDQLKSDEEVFFYRLLVNCDDYGRIDARLPILKARLYPLKNMKSNDINRYLTVLANLKPEPLIILYTNNGLNYIQITKWEKHQQVRAKRSKCPAIDDVNSTMISSDISGYQKIAYVPENPYPNPIRNPNTDASQNIIVQALSMTQEEYQKLIALYTKEAVDEKIEYARNYAPLTKKYKNLYLTLNSWLKGDIEKKNTPSKPKQFEERSYNETDIEDLYYKPKKEIK
jgi:hypothetical protein